MATDRNRFSFLTLGMLLLFNDCEEGQFLSTLKGKCIFGFMGNSEPLISQARMPQNRHEKWDTLQFIIYLGRVRLARFMASSTEGFTGLRSYLSQYLNFKCLLLRLAPLMLCLASWAHYTVNWAGVYRQVFCALPKAILSSKWQWQQRSPGLRLYWDITITGFSWESFLN